MGVYTFNVIPLIAQYKFADIAPPTPEMKKAMQDSCAPYVRQMRHCQRCRADAIGKLGHDVNSCSQCREVERVQFSLLFFSFGSFFTSRNNSWKLIRTLPKEPSHLGGSRGI